MGDRNPFADVWHRDIESVSGEDRQDPWQADERWLSPEPPPYSDHGAPLNEGLSRPDWWNYREFLDDDKKPSPSSMTRETLFEKAGFALAEDDGSLDVVDDERPPTPYMQQQSYFSLDPPPDERSFMEWYPAGNATITFPTEDGDFDSIRNVNLSLVEQRSIVLAMAFEPSRSGPQLFLEALNSRTATPFLRFMYTGSYANRYPDDRDPFEDVPTSLLLHCQLYRLGDIFDLEELESQAYVNVLRQCEFGCYSSDKPIDLCAAIRFVYQHLSTDDRIIDAIVNYCVACFLGHRLGEDPDFRNAAYDFRPFSQALCLNSRNRKFENETAAAIIRMPFKTYKPDTYASREDFGKGMIEDVVFRYHSNDRLDGPTEQKHQKRPAEQNTVKLPLRQRRKTNDSSVVEVTSEAVDNAFDFDFEFNDRKQPCAPVSSAWLSALTTPLRTNHAQRLALAEESKQGDVKTEQKPEDDLTAALRPSDAKAPASAEAPEQQERKTESRFDEIIIDSDSDTSSFVDVKYEDISKCEQDSLWLPLRPRDVPPAATRTSSDPDDLDYEWVDG